MRNVPSSIMFVVLLLVACVASAEVQVYDANNQHLGILISPKGNFSNGIVDVYIPSIDAIAPIFVIEESDDGIPGDIAWREVRSCEDPACTTVTAGQLGPQELMRAGDCMSCEGRYYIGVRSPTGYLGDPRTIATEVLEEEIPFSLPVALPIRYEYTSDGDSSTPSDIIASIQHDLQAQQEFVEALQLLVEENRYLLEQLPQLRKVFEDLDATENP